MICLLKAENVKAASGREPCAWLGVDEVLVAGRQADCGLCVDDTHMSRRHFMVDAAAGSFRIRDLGSLNGTQLNGVPISAAPLCSGDFIRAGNTIFVVKIQSRVADFPLPQSNATVSGLSEADDLEATRRFRGAPPAPEFQGSQQPENTIAAEEQVDVRAIPSVPAPAGKSVILPTMQGPVAPHGVEMPGPRDQSGQVRRPLVEILQPPVPDGLDRFFVSRLQKPAVGDAYRLIGGRKRAGELYQLLTQRYRLGLVVNRDQLDSDCGKLFSYLAIRDAAVALSDTVYWLEYGDNDGLIRQLASQAAGADAAVSVGIRHSDPPPADTVAELCHMLCYPSLLFSSLMHADGEEATALFRRIAFIVFEKDRSGDLYLFTEPGFQVTGTLND